jgi:hypothetical protein
LPELTVRVCEIPVRVAADDSRFIASAARRYAPFLSTGRPDIALDLELVEKRMRPFRDEPRVVWDGRAGRVERHDLELDLAPGMGRGRIVRGLSPLDSLLRIALSFELVKRSGFLCHSAAVDGWLFPGVSGAGKSTLGRSVPRKRLLADELVGVVDGRLWGTPFRGDFLRGTNFTSRRLEAILLLDRHSRPRGVREVSKAAALIRLLQCVLYFGDDPPSGKRILAAARRCVMRAQTFALSYDARKTSFSGVETMIKKALS